MIVTLKTQYLAKIEDTKRDFSLLIPPVCASMIKLFVISLIVLTVLLVVESTAEGFKKKKRKVKNLFHLKTS
jgi:hypothetical protein